MSSRVSLAEPPKVVEQVILLINRPQLCLEPSEGGANTLEVFAESSRFARGRVALSKIKLRDRCIQVTAQSILRLKFESDLAMSANQFLDFTSAQGPRPSTRTSLSDASFLSS